MPIDETASSDEEPKGLNAPPDARVAANAVAIPSDEQIADLGSLVLAARWWRGKPRFGAPDVIASVGVHLSALAIRAHGEIWHNADPNAASALDARLDAAEKNLSSMRDRLNELEREMEKKLEQQTHDLNKEKQERVGEDKKIRNQLETAQAGSLYISAMGGTWLVAGVIMSAIPSELAFLASSFLP